MAEEEKKEEDKSEEGKKEEDSSSSKPLSPNERAEANIAAMKAENDRMEKNILAQQEMRAADMLGGTADAGQAPAPKTEETPEQYAQRAISGELNE